MHIKHGLAITSAVTGRSLVHLPELSLAYAASKSMKPSMEDMGKTWPQVRVTRGSVSRAAPSYSLKGFCMSS